MIPARFALVGVTLAAIVLLAACSSNEIARGAVEVVGEEVEPVDDAEETNPVTDDSPPRADAPSVRDAESDRVVRKDGHISVQHQARRADGSFVGVGNERLGDEVHQWWQSNGGLQWTPLDVAGLPDGRVIGFAKVDDTYHAAINELDVPSAVAQTLVRNSDPFAPLEAQQVNITMWESNDAESWRPSEHYQNFSGQAARLFFIDFHGDGWSTSASILRSELPEDSRLVDYLSPAVDEPTARATCFAQQNGRGEGSTLELYDCDKELLVSLDGGEEPAKFLNADCIRRNLWLDMNPSTFAFFDNDDTPLFLEPPGFDSGYGVRLAGSESWVFNDRWPHVNLAPVCQTPTDRVREAGIEVNRWDPATESFVKIPVPPEANRLLDAYVVPAPDGSIVLVSKTQVWESDDVGATWRLRIDHPTWISGQANPLRGLSISRDGQIAIAREPGLIHVELIPGVWTEIPYEGPNQFAYVKSVTDDFVFISGLDRGSQEIRVAR